MQIFLLDPNVINHDDCDSRGNHMRKPCNCRGVSLAKEAAVNANCHGFTGGVVGHDGHVMPQPQIVLIYWDQYFTTTPSAVDEMARFVTAICGGHFDGLSQYGVRGPSPRLSVAIDMGKYPTPNSKNPGVAFTEAQLQAQLISWLDDDAVAPTPLGDERNLIYLIFTPTDTVISQNGTSTGFCGYHLHGRYHASTTRDNLIWAAIRGYTTTGSVTDFVNSISYCVSHELAEAFVNPDGHGYFSDVNGCEIGDICEANVDTGSVRTVPYRDWNVELYWSNVHSMCISGAGPHSPVAALFPDPESYLDLLLFT